MLLKEVNKLGLSDAKKQKVLKTIKESLGKPQDQNQIIRKKEDGVIVNVVNDFSSSESENGMQFQAQNLDNSMVDSEQGS